MTEANTTGRIDPLGYVPALDGLRGVAVLGVVVFHFAVGWLPGGYLGVDAFFVLSGFLITRILLVGATAGSGVGLGVFWVRRLRRLVPALVVFLAAVVAYMAFFADGSELAQLRRESLATLFYVANWEQIASGVSYFDEFAAPSPLRHTWSLAIEEQFYLLWPLVVWAAAWVVARRRRWRFGQRSADTIFWISVLGASASVIWSAVLWAGGASHTRLYFSTDTRVQALLVGCALGAAWAGGRLTGARGRPLLVPVLGGLSLVAIIWLWTLDITADVLFGTGLAVHSLLVGFVILACLVPGPVRRVLAIAPLRWLGALSYGVYLWHVLVQAVITADRTGLRGYQLFSVRFAVTIGIALASYLLVEQPIRRGARLSGRLRASAAYAVASLALVVGVAAVASDPEPSMAQRFEAAQAEQATATEIPEFMASTDDVAVDATVIGDEILEIFADRPAHDRYEVDGVTIDLDVVERSFCPLDAGPRRQVEAPSGEIGRCGDWLAALEQAASETPDPDVLIVAVGFRPELGPRDDDPFNVLASADVAEVERQLVEALAVFDADVPVLLLAAEADPAQPRSAEFRFWGALERAVSVAPDTRALAPIDQLTWPDVLTLAGERVEPDSLLATDFTQVMLLGDSIGWTLGYGWYGDPESGALPSSDDDVRLWNRALMFCELVDQPRFFRGRTEEASTACREWRTEWPAPLAEFEPDVTLVVHGAWELFDRRIDDQWAEFGSAAHRGLLRDALDDVVDLLATDDRPVVFATLPPGVRTLEDSPPEWTTDGQDVVAAYNELLAEVVAEHPDRTALLDLGGWLCPDGQCRSDVDGVTIREDGLHFSPSGAAPVADWISSELDRLLAT